MSATDAKYLTVHAEHFPKLNILNLEVDLVANLVLFFFAAHSQTAQDRQVWKWLGNDASHTIYTKFVLFSYSCFTGFRPSEFAYHTVKRFKLSRSLELTMTNLSGRGGKVSNQSNATIAVNLP